MDYSISLRKSKNKKKFQPPDFEIDFLIDSEAESIIIKIPTWNELKSLHPDSINTKRASKLATSQGSTLDNYGMVQLFLFPRLSHRIFLNIPIDISSQANNTISIHKDYVKVLPITIDATS